MTTSTPRRTRSKPPGLPRATELQCEAGIITTARRRGWRVHGEEQAIRKSGKMSVPIKGDAGWFDLVLSHRQRNWLLFVELKRPPRKFDDPNQIAWQQEMRAQGLIAVVWWVPDEYDEILNFINGPTMFRLPQRNPNWSPDGSERGWSR